jgi:excisionase family DNA binding protein
MLPAPMFCPSVNEVSARGAAVLLGISRCKVTSLIFKGVIPARSLGKTYVIDRIELERFRIEHPELLG